MQYLTVFIPGMVGSRLRQSAQTGGRLLWHEDGINTLSNLVGNPALLQLSTKALRHLLGRV